MQSVIAYGLSKIENCSTTTKVIFLSLIARAKLGRDWDFCMENAVVFGKLEGFFCGRLRTADAEAESRLTYSSLPFTAQLS